MARPSKKPARSARTDAAHTRASHAKKAPARPRVVRIATAAERRSTRSTAARLLGLTDTRTQRLVAQLKAGLPYTALAKLADAAGLPLGELASLAEIPARTLSRRKTQGRLQPGESERLLRLSHLYARALDLFDDDVEAARRWLTTPKMALEGQTPLRFATTEVGARDVEDLIGRLEHGVYS